MFLDGRYLSAEESDFVQFVTSDLAEYLRSISVDKSKRVLIFPPILNNFRFLIHKTVEEFPTLSSFSLGEGDNRRTVICQKEILISSMNKSPESFNESHKNKNSANDASVIDDFSRTTNDSTSSLASSPHSTIFKTKVTKKKKPDQLIYVPRPRRLAPDANGRSNEADNQSREREKDEKSNSSEEKLKISKHAVENREEKKIKECDFNNCLITVQSKKKLKKSKSSNTHENSIAFKQENNIDSLSAENSSFLTSLKAEEERYDASGMSSQSSSNPIQTNLSESSKDKQTLQAFNCLISEDVNNLNGNEYMKFCESSQKSNLTDEYDKYNIEMSRTAENMIEPENELSEKNFSLNSMKDVDETEIAVNDESWDKLFNESGDALHSSIMKELTIAVGAVTVQKTQFDYLNYQPSEPEIDEGYDHLIEIYDFPASFQDGDLNVVFKDFQESGFVVKWVDDTHAIGVFSGRTAAQSALNRFNHPMMKVRPIRQSSRQTKLKAKRCTEFLLPYKERPVMVASVARNLVAGALGIQTKVSKEKREEERQKLKAARERKKTAVKQKEDAWEGMLGNSSLNTTH